MSLYFPYLTTQKCFRRHFRLLPSARFSRMPLQIIWISYKIYAPTVVPALYESPKRWPHHQMLCSPKQSILDRMPRWAGALVRALWAGISPGLSFGPCSLERKQIYVKHHGLGFKQRGCAAFCASRIFTVIRQDDLCPFQIINKGWVLGIGFVRPKLIKKLSLLRKMKQPRPWDEIPNEIYCLLKCCRVI